MNEKYKDMLHLPHPVSATHPRMALQDRAAQFSPFAALAGYDDALRETARRTDRFVELDEDRKQRSTARFLICNSIAGHSTGENYLFCAG